MSLLKPRELGEGCSRLVPSRFVEEPEVPHEEREAPGELIIRGTRLADIGNTAPKGDRNVGRVGRSSS